MTFSVTTDGRQNISGQVLLVFSCLICSFPSSLLPICTLTPPHQKYREGFLPLG